MGEQENIQAFREIIEALNAHDLDRFRMLLNDEHVMESDVLPESVYGLEASLETMQRYFSAFPDLHFDIEQVFASGDYVTLRWRATGTHQGELSGIPATNRSAEVHGCTVREFRDGKSTREWTYWDTGRLMQQLGVLPASQ